MRMYLSIITLSLNIRMYLFIFTLILSMSLIETTAGEESPVSFQETPVRNSQQCQILCDRIENCQGSVFDLKNRTCSLFSTQILQGASLIQDFNTIIHVKEPLVIQCNGGRRCGSSDVCVTMEYGASSLCVPAPTCAAPPELATLQTPVVRVSPMGTEVMYSCGIGYNRTSGEGLSVCKFDQRWSMPYLRCQIIDCGGPPEISRMATGSTSTTTYNSPVVYTCSRGYSPVSGRGNSVCHETGGWSTPTLVCETIDCGAPLSINRMDLGSVTSTTYGSVISYTCSPGFYNESGTGDSSCIETGQWSTPTLVCEVSVVEIVDCGNPPDYPGMSYGATSTTTYGSRTMYNCSLGYYFVSGSGDSACQQSREWSTPTLVCHIIDCGQPAAITRMSVATNKATTYGSVLKYSCLLGYHPASGNGRITCLETREWSPLTLDCQAIPGLIAKRTVRSDNKTLICRTVTQSFNINGGVSSVGCENDEMLTDCSARVDVNQMEANGIEIDVIGGKPKCIVRYVTHPGEATARCCKAHRISCEYIGRGPSLVTDDAMIAVPCYKNFKMLGCNAHTLNGTMDGDRLNGNKCYGQTGHGSATGTYGNGVCCSAPNLRCQQSRVRNIQLVNNELVASCPSGFVLTGCSGRDHQLRSRGTYIQDDECRLATDRTSSEVSITCCNATLSR